MSNNTCLICGAQSDKLFSTRILHKYDINYHRCSSCGFIQSDAPYWLDEAYSDAITSMDIGLIYRNLVYSSAVDSVIKSSFDYKQIFLDYAGGYGMYVRLMRDKGFDFYWDDKYCDNLFAKHFTLDELPINQRFEVVTAFEIFEHLANPLDEIEKLFSYSDSIIFSTEMVPNKEICSSNDWWYFAPEGGQHIAFYTPKAFEVIANKFSCNFYTNGKDLHILTKKTLKRNPLDYSRTFWDKVVDKLVGILNRSKSNGASDLRLASKIPHDVQYIRGIVHPEKK